MQKDIGRAAVLDAALAANVLTEDEVKTLQLTDKMRRAVVDVDAFPQTQLSGAIANEAEANAKQKPVAASKPEGPKAA